VVAEEVEEEDEKVLYRFSLAMSRLCCCRWPDGSFFQKKAMVCVLLAWMASVVLGMINYIRLVLAIGDRCSRLCPCGVVGKGIDLGVLSIGILSLLDSSF